MKQTPIDSQQLALLSSLANGIIPADDADSGAAEVNAAARIAQKIESGVNANLYLSGLKLAADLARTKFALPVEFLSPLQVHELLALLQTQLPAFFKQLRMDVCSLYLSDPKVWQRIGFPGPSSETGGHPDFAAPQSIARVSRLPLIPSPGIPGEG